MTESDAPSALAAALFAVHPLNVESVAWVTERKDVLAVFFGLLSLLAYSRYAKRPGWIRYVPVGIFFALALMSKPMLVMMPAIFLLLDLWPMARFDKIPWPKLFLEKTPLMLLSIFSFLVTWMSFPGEQKGTVWAGRILDIPGHCGWYAWKFLWPAHLSIYYPPQLYFLSGARAAVLGAGLAGSLVAAAVFFRKAPGIAAGWLWFWVGLVPVIRLEVVADRFTYFPGIGIAIFGAWGIDALMKKYPGCKIPAAILAGGILTALAVHCHIQTIYWRTSAGLFRHSLEVTGNENWVAHNNLGKALTDEGKIAEAFTHLSESLRLRPDQPTTHLNMGNVLVAQGRIEEAMSHYFESLRLNPRQAKAHYNLAVLFKNFGKNGEALEHFDEAIRINPYFIEAHLGLGTLLSMMGRWEEALMHLREVLRIKSDMPEANYRIANILAGRGETQNAIGYYHRELVLNPDDPLAANDLAWILATNPDPNLRNPAEAVKLAGESSRRMGHNQPEMLDTLAAAMASAGRFQEAVQIAARAVDLAKASGQPAMASEIEVRRELYKSGRPYSERR